LSVAKSPQLVNPACNGSVKNPALSFNRRNAFLPSILIGGNLLEDDMFSSLLSQGYILEYKSDPQSHSCYKDYNNDIEISRGYAHHFCGEQHIEGANCPNCNKPLLCFLRIDTSDPRFGLDTGNASFIPLLYCWTCNIAQDEFYYRPLKDGSIEIAEYGHGGVAVDFPYENYPVHFPGSKAELLSITSDAQAAIRRVNSGDLALSSMRREYPGIYGCQHQLGGEPFLIQRDPDYELDCPKCKKVMPFLASIADNCLDPRGFTENDGVQVLYHYCKACNMLGAFHAVD
jgi:hypothetical protein